MSTLRQTFKTFKAHKRLYYDSARDHWFTSVRVPESQSEEESTTDEAPPTSFGHKGFSASTDKAPSFSYYDMDDGKSAAPQCEYRDCLAALLNYCH